MAQASWQRLQTPLQDLFLARLSVNFRRPASALLRYQRGQSHFAREVLNRAQIVLVEMDYQPDVGPRAIGIGGTTVIAGGSGLVVTSTIILVDAPAPGTQTTSVSLSEMDPVVIVGDGVYTPIASAGANGNVRGVRRYTLPEPSHTLRAQSG